MLITSKPWSIAQRRPPRSTGPLPLKPAPSTRTLWRPTFGARARTIPAQAVPWPQRSPSASSFTSIRPSSVFMTATAPSSSPTSGWPRSTPLSRMQTRAPSPVEPPQAHSRVTRSGHSTPIAIRSAEPAGRLQAGKLGSPKWAGSFCASGGSYARGLGRGYAAAEFVEHRPGGLDALRQQRAFQIGDEYATKLGVRLGACDDPIQLPAGSRQLPCRAHPGGRSRREHADQAGQPFDVVFAHPVPCSLDGSPGGFLPTNTRTRELRSLRAFDCA